MKAFHKIQEFILNDLENWAAEIFIEHPEYKECSSEWLTKEYAWEFSQIYGDFQDEELIKAFKIVCNSEELASFEESMLNKIEKNIKKYLGE